MTTRYKHRVTIAVPELMIYKANQLALIVGESPEDVNTFTTMAYQDSTGGMYSVVSAVTTEDFIKIPSLGLPDSPIYADYADRVAASEALDSIGQVGGVLMDVDSDPMSAIESWGLTILTETTI